MASSCEESDGNARPAHWLLRDAEPKSKARQEVRLAPGEAGGRPGAAPFNATGARGGK